MAESEGLFDHAAEKPHQNQQHGFLKRFILIYKSSEQDKDLENFYKNPKVIQEIIATAFSAVVLVLMMLWLYKIEFCLDTGPLTKDPWERRDPLPSIVWHTTNIWWIKLNKRITCKNGSRAFECEVFKRQSAPENPDAYLFYAPDVDHFPLPRNPKVLWGLLQDETPINRLMFVYEEALNLFNFSSTFGRFSDMPMPLMKSRGPDALTSLKYFIKTSDKNAVLSEIAPVLYIQTHCNTPTQRDAYVERLMEYIAVDSYGACLRNKNLPLSDVYTNVGGYSITFRLYLYGDELLNFISRYKFMITIENAVCNDYISEKIWRALEVGTVPIYYGSPLIRDWLPNNRSAILLEDFPTPELLSRHLHYLLSNDTAYEEYLEHKTLEKISNQKFLKELKTRSYQMDLAGTAINFECFICEKLYKNDETINMVTRKHYDCPMEAISAVTQSRSPNISWQIKLDNAKDKIDRLMKEVNYENNERRLSETSWWIDDAEEIAVHTNV